MNKLCHKQFSVKTGSALEDWPITLDKWLAAVWLIVNCKNGVSSYEIARHVGVTQKSGWFRLHRIREALRKGSLLPRPRKTNRTQSAALLPQGDQGHPVAAYIKGVIPRALEQGRTVPIHVHLRMHKDSIETFLKIHRKFADNQNISFFVLNNTGHEQESFPADVDYLKAVKYDSPVLEAAIRKGSRMELTAGTHSEKNHPSPL